MFQWRLFCMLLIFIELILSSLFNSVLVFWHDIVYISSEHICFIKCTNIRAILWFTISVYSISSLLLSIVYLRIISFLGHQSKSLSIVVLQRQQWNLIAIRRIFLTIAIASIVIILIMSLICREEIYLALRILSIFLVWSLAIVGLSMITFTVQLKVILQKNLFLLWKWFI